ncbi:hypothetical protein CU048_15555 [Beijerinckiaceae bacterium]|nr:hypothetical protein CU048_15555 [Beijerinckiaceae bacterium]
MFKYAVALAVGLTVLTTHAPLAATDNKPPEEEKTVTVEGANAEEATVAATKWIDDHGGIFVHRIMLRKDGDKTIASIVYVEKW